VKESRLNTLMRAIPVCSVLLTLAIRLCVAQNAGVIVSTCTGCDHDLLNLVSSLDTAAVHVSASTDSPRIAALLQHDAVAAAGGHTNKALPQTARQLKQTQTHIQGAASPPQQQQHGDHKPLFPVSGLEVAVLVIAGVVLFIAAGWCAVDTKFLV
jgi:hypothetical protein